MKYTNIISNCIENQYQFNIRVIIRDFEGFITHTYKNDTYIMEFSRRIYRTVTRCCLSILLI